MVWVYKRLSHPSSCRRVYVTARTTSYMVYWVQEKFVVKPTEHEHKHNTEKKNIV